MAERASMAEILHRGPGEERALQLLHVLNANNDVVIDVDGGDISDDDNADGEEGGGGAWRDEIYCCLINGVCDTSFYMSFGFCQPLLLADIMMRLRMDWMGRPTSYAGSRSTAKKIVYVLILETFLYAQFGLSLKKMGALSLLFITVLALRTRMFIRKKNRIAGHWCGDFLVSWCCLPLSISQMARHTQDLDGGYL